MNGRLEDEKVEDEEQTVQAWQSSANYKNYTSDYLH